MTSGHRALDSSTLFETEGGLVDRRIFSDEAVYQLELERIFARAWNFMCHDSQIPNPGDFFMTFIGEDRVIVVRDNEGNPQVLLNTCRHRGNAVCRAEEGHATSFMCTYHGWTYDLQGKLVGVPGFKEVYHEELDREAWGLITAAQVDSYEGFIFANMDPQAPRLDEYLGNIGRLALDMMAVRGRMSVVGGVQKYVIPSNWKFVADNTADWHHVPVSHASAHMIGRSVHEELKDFTPSSRGLGHLHTTWLGEYGHSFTGIEIPSRARKKMARNRAARYEWRTRPEAKEALGGAVNMEGTPHVFPNFSTTFTSATLRVPRGPHATEIWLFAFQNADEQPETNLKYLQHTKAMNGPGGLVEQDDSENWQGSTGGARGTVSQRFPLHYGMGSGHGELVDEEGQPPRIESTSNEHAQRWFYRAWSEWLAAEAWHGLRESHSVFTKLPNPGRL